MAAEGQDPTQAPESPDAPPSGMAAAALMASTSPPEPQASGLPADAVRTSPEYLALQEQARQSARQAGSMRAELERVRQQQEAERQAAEAQRLAALQQEMETILGQQANDFGLFAQLLQSDPVAAARRFAELTRVQSPPTPAPAPAEAAPVEGGPPVPAPTQPPQPPSMGVAAQTPLGQTQQATQDERIQALDDEVAKVVQQNQTLATRARVTDKMRATAIGQYLRSGYLKAIGIDPDLTLNQRG